MIGKTWVGRGGWGAILLLVAGVLWSGGVVSAKTHASADGALGGKILSLVREKYGVPENVKLTMDPFQSSGFAGFSASTIVADDGKDAKKNPVFLTGDHRLLILGNLFVVKGEVKSDIVQHIREQFKIPSDTRIEVGPVRNSKFPNFVAALVTVERGTHKQSEDVFLTRDRRTLVVGSILNLAVDPRAEALRIISTANQPSQGSARSPVTIVEYSDLECPMCARLHEFLEKDLLPKYRGKVRVIFKEFPLVNIHDWSLTGAIANECIFHIKPDAFAAYRSLIFQNQGITNAANVRDSLLAYADQVGVDRVALAGCLDSKASLARVDAGANEAKQLDISSTPTSYINGRMLVGFPSPEVYYKAVDDALKEAARAGKKKLL